MDSFESEFNVIHQLLKNEETYAKLIIGYDQFMHYYKYYLEYCSTYNDNDHNGDYYFVNMVINALQNNTYVNEIYMKNTFCDMTNIIARSEFIKKLTGMRNWKSIYICGESENVLDALLDRQNPNLMKLKLSNIHLKFQKFIQNTPFLEEFEFDLYTTPQKNYPAIIQGICESNIKTLIINNIFFPSESFESLINFEPKFINDIIKCKIRNLHLRNSSHTNKFDLMDNYTILNFMVNEIQPDYAQEILYRNRNYALTVLLCMNRKIIPRCIFKNCILKHLFII